MKTSLALMCMFVQQVTNRRDLYDENKTFRKCLKDI